MRRGRLKSALHALLSHGVVTRERQQLALRAAYGTRYATLPVETRARAMRAGANYLRAIGVTERTLPDTEALAKLIRLTIDVMRQTT